MGEVWGGPYSQIRELRETIRASNYELGLIADGMRRPFNEKKLNEVIATCRQKISEILAQEKAKKMLSKSKP